MLHHTHQPTPPTTPTTRGPDPTALGPLIPTQGWETAVRHFGPTYGGQIPPVKDWANLILDEIRWTAGHIQWLRNQISGLEEIETHWGIQSEDDITASEFPGRNTKRAAVPHTLILLYQNERDRLTKQLTLAHKIGISQKQIQLAESLGSELITILAGVINTLDLTPAQREIANREIPKTLRALAEKSNEPQHHTL